jgi:transposase-like protein
MGNQRLSPELMQEAVNLVAKHGTVTAAAAALGMPRNTMDSRYQSGRRAGMLPTEGAVEPTDPNITHLVESLRRENDRLTEALAKASRPKFSVRQDAISESTDLLVVAMGDGHDSPKIKDKSRFEIAGKFAADLKCDLFISMGDFLDMLSLCFHVPDENYTGRAKPSFIQDIESAGVAFDAINSGLGNWNPERHKVQGNHENRLYRIEDQAPSSVGMYVSLYDEMMRRAKFTYSPFGATTFYGGVGFTHCPISIMGKPMGGKQVLTNIGRDSVYDSVTGHTHVPGEFKTRKIGQRHITSVDTGCFLPYGMIEDYAEHTLGGWDWGLTELRIRGGRIESRRWHSLRELEERYGSV